MKAIATLIVCLLLSACSSIQTKPEPINAMPQASSMTECREPDDLVAGTPADMLVDSLAMSKLYRECKLKHEDLIKFVKKDKKLDGEKK